MVSEILQNITDDGIVHLSLPKGVKVIGFSNDTAVVMVAKHIHESKIAANEALRKIQSWLEIAGLVLVDNKIKTVLITIRKRLKYIKIRVGFQVISNDAALITAGLPSTTSAVSAYVFWKSNLHG